MLAREVVGAGFGHFLERMPDYASDDRLAGLLGMGIKVVGILRDYRLCPIMCGAVF